MNRSWITPSLICGILIACAPAATKQTSPSQNQSAHDHTTTDHMAVDHTEVHEVTPPSSVLGTITVTRDEFGVPHIRATNERGAFFALGYVHAQDRLWQMELNRRTGAGRLAEVLGPAALAQDKFLRTWGFYRAAETALPALSARTRNILEQYARGVNAFIDEGKLPIEFSLLGFKPEPWKPADSIVWIKMMAYDLSDNWSEEVENARIVAQAGLNVLNEIKPGYPKDWPTIVRLEDYLRDGRPYPGLEPARSGGPTPATGQPTNGSPRTLAPGMLRALERVSVLGQGALRFGFEDSFGSNNWVLAGSRTKSGKPLLANDPHLRLQSPGLWYLADIQSSDYRAIGATLPGVPGIVIGHNDRIAWGVTNGSPDTQDLFVLDLEGDGKGYRTPKGIEAITTHQETIKVRGGADETIEVRESRFGPIISDLGITGTVANAAANNEAVALRWVALEPGDTTLEAFLGVSRAQNLGEFRAALERSFVTPMQNIIYADVDGNIAYIAPGKIPKRTWDGRLPIRATTGADWQGYVPFADLPQVTNPREGFIVTANNKMWPHSVPDYSLYLTEGYRAQRIRERILESTQHDLDSMSSIQGDTYSLIARALVPDLLHTTPKSDAARRLIEAVRNWDFRFDLKSSGGTAFAFYFRELSRLLEDELGIKYVTRPNFLMPALQGSRWCDDVRTGPTESCNDWRSRALEIGAQALETRLGSTDWRWERLHQVNITAIIGSAPVVGQLFNRTIATPGSFLTVDVGAYNQDTFIQPNGPSYRQIVDLANFNASRYIYPMGQSGDPFSPHFADLLERWRDNRFIPMSTSPAQWGVTDTFELKP